jgi:hypothetical protein
LTRVAEHINFYLPLNMDALHEQAQLAQKPAKRAYAGTHLRMSPIAVSAIGVWSCFLEWLSAYPKIPKWRRKNPGECFN